MLEEDYVNENARARWIERHAAPALAPAPVEPGEEDDEEDDDAVGAAPGR
jgi:hypothetical protein